MTAIFITGTGTDIGKTFITAGLIRHLRAAGQTVEALKPLTTGFYPVEAEGSDPGRLLKALGQQPTLQAIEAISPFRFSAPLSPDMAARREGRSIDFDALVQFCRGAVAKHQGTLFIEGVGGVMVPLGPRYTVVDWMAALKLPVLLVAGTYLGTMSHTLSALEVLKRHNLTVKAIVLNQTPGSPVPSDETVVTLTPLVGGIPIVLLPRLAQGETSHPALAAIANLL